MALIQDLPVTFHDEATLVDGNHKFSLLDPKIPNSRIYTELYVTKKGNYNFMPIGTTSDVHPGAQLYDEGNFTNIGGGMMTFERKFADVPPPSSEVSGTYINTGSVRVTQSGEHFGKKFSYIGGTLLTGAQIITMNYNAAANGQATDVFNFRTTSFVYANVITRYIDADEILDTTPEIMTVKPTTTTTSTLTYTRIVYDRVVEQIKNPIPLFDNSYMFGVASSDFLQPSPIISRYVPYTTNVRLERREETVTREVVTEDASIFPSGIVFRREMLGRYLGNIMIMKEYCLNDDVVLQNGRVQSGDSAIEIANVLLANS